MKKFALLVVAALFSFMFVESALGAIIFTNSSNAPTGVQSAFDADISNSDLVNVGQPTLASYTVSEPADPGLNAGNLNNGTSAPAYWPSATNNLVTATFVLDTAINPYGYDITNITRINGWGDGAAYYSNQVFDVLYSVVGDEANFLPLTSVSYLPFTIGDNVPGASKVMITDSNGVLASGVAALQFNFYPVPGTNPQIGVFRELDVFGSATAAPVIPAPEPSTLLLGVLGLLAVKMRRVKNRPV